MNRRFYALAACVLSIAVLLAGCQSGEETSSPHKTTASSSSSAKGILSNFSATDLEGRTVDPSAFSGYDLIMVNVWATFCNPCLSEMPELGELAGEYAGKRVRIVGLVTDVLSADGSISDRQVEIARDIVEATNADYLHILPSEDLFSLVSQISSVPTTFFVDSAGRQVGSTYLGAKEKEKWASIIDKTLAEVTA